MLVVLRVKDIPSGSPAGIFFAHYPAWQTSDADADYPQQAQPACDEK
jgi:hypothetical protein